MKHIAIFAAATLAVVAIAGAQTTTQPPAAQPPSADRPTAQQPAAQPSQAENKITVSGCLKQGAAGSNFILADASAVSAAGAAGQAKPEAVGTAGMKKTYNLAAKPGEDLSKHVNHRIEVTGAVSAARAEPPAAGGAAKPEASAAPTETLNVQSFKMVAASCS